MFSKTCKTLVSLVLCMLLFRCGDDSNASAEVSQAPPETPSEETPAAEETPHRTEAARAAEPQPAEEEPLPFIAIDTHIDTPQRMLDDGDDITGPLEGGHVDVPRMREGGLTGAFFSVYVSPTRFRDPETWWPRALALTEHIRGAVEAHPETLALCTTGEEIRAAARDGKIAVLMGVEGGHALGTDDPRLAIQRLRRLYELGNRYMTITWSIDNPFGHSSSGDAPEEGLTRLGRRIIREMNDLGMIVDISHVSDQTFWDIMEIAERPVLASHSSARALSNHPRNMTDAMIRRVGANGGAICANFYTQYIDASYRGRRRRIEFQRRALFRPLEDQYENWVDRGAAKFRLALELDPDLNPPSVATLADHIAHIIEVGGPGAACLGSDFDGVPELPIGMEDVSDLGVLREELESRELNVRAIFGENVLRVLDAQRIDAEADSDAERISPQADSDADGP